jgi:hypothetical protein
MKAARAALSAKDYPRYQRLRKELATEYPLSIAALKRIDPVVLIGLDRSYDTVQQARANKYPLDGNAARV